MMQDSQAKPLAIGALLRDSVLLFFTHWRRHFVLSFACAVPLGVLMAVGYLDPVIHYIQQAVTGPELQRMPDGTPSMTVSPNPANPLPVLRTLSLWALMLMSVSTYATGWWSAVFDLQRLGAPRRASWLDALAAVLGRFILYGVLMLGVESICVMVGGGLLVLMAPLLQQTGSLAFARFLVTILLQVISMGVGMRLAVSIPPLLWHENISFARAWVASRGQTFILGLTGLALALPGFILLLLAADLLGAALKPSGGVISGLSILLLAPLIFLYYSLQFAALAVVFRQLRARQLL